MFCQNVNKTEYTFRKIHCQKPLHLLPGVFFWSWVWNKSYFGPEHLFPFIKFPNSVIILPRGSKRKQSSTYLTNFRILFLDLRSVKISFYKQHHHLSLGLSFSHSVVSSLDLHRQEDKNRPNKFVSSASSKRPQVPKVLSNWHLYRTSLPSVNQSF